MVFAPGDQLKKYEICSVLGVGGMGEVYLARDRHLQRNVAIKILPQKISSDPGVRQRFLEEARTASALSHPNIAHIYEVDKEDSVNFFVMEYVEGRTLREELQNHPHELLEILDIMVQVGIALTAAHAAGIVHRDIKPENIMIRPDGYIKVLDFGLAKQTQELPETVAPNAPTVGRMKTDPGVVMGTVTYMSPEQIRARPVDTRTDLWSLGVLFYEMLSGHPPFRGESSNDVIAAILEREPPPLNRFVSNLPDGIDWIVMKALTKDREQRYQSAKDFVSDVQRLKSKLATAEKLVRSNNEHSSDSIPKTKSVNGMSSAEYVITGIRSHKWAALLSVLTILILMVGIVAYVMSRPVKTQPRQLLLTRLTFDTGLQSNPSWSPDGRFIAYDSDLGGNLDIWVQPLNRGEARRITDSPAADWQPDWSPDGSRIVFRSEREGGGLFVVSALGGRERKIASFGYKPKWSNNGKTILFLSPGTRIFDYPRVYILNVDSPEPPVEILKTVANDAEPVKKGYVAWCPDDEHVSFVGDGGAFWTVPLSGGVPLKSEIDDAVQKRITEAGLDLGNFRWSPKGDALYFEGTSHGVKNLWKISVDPNSRRWIDGPQRLTTGFSYDTDIALSRDGTKLAYSNQMETTRAWLFPFDAQTGRLKGAGHAITDSQSNAWFFDLAPDGQKIVFSAQQHGQVSQALSAKTLDGSESRVLLQDSALRFSPRWSPDGRWLAYSLFRPASGISDPNESPRIGPIALLDVQTGQERLLTSNGSSADYMYDWSPDGHWVVGSTNRQSPSHWAVAMFPVAGAPNAEAGMRVLVSDQKYDFWAPRFSPDGRWICYIAQSADRPGVSVLYSIDPNGGTPIRLTAEDSWADKPRWSPDGKTIYFISNRGSTFLNVWGIRFDPTKGQAISDSFRVTNFEQPGQVISTQLAFAEIALNRKSLLLPLAEVSGSVWVLENVDPG